MNGGERWRKGADGFFQVEVKKALINNGEKERTEQAMYFT